MPLDFQHGCSFSISIRQMSENRRVDRGGLLRYLLGRSATVASGAKRIRRMEPAKTPDATATGLNASFPRPADLRNRPQETSVCYQVLHTARVTERANFRF